MNRAMVTILSIRVTNGKQARLLTRKRTIMKEQVEVYRRRLARLYRGEVDFTIKSYEHRSKP